MKDIDELKTELNKQKIENDNLKNELIKRRNDDEKNISEIRKEIENLKIAISNISQKELNDNKSEKKANEMKKDIEKLDKNKKISKISKEEKLSKKNECLILERESNLNSKDEFKKDFEEKNNNIKKEIIQFEKEEIKQDLNIKKAKYFEIENIKITNIGNDKGFKNLYMVIDINTSSKGLLFWENTIIQFWHKLSLSGPLLKGENLNNLITLYINDPNIGEYTIFAYIREKPEGDNLSRPLKLTINFLLIEQSE